MAEDIKEAVAPTTTPAAITLGGQAETKPAQLTPPPLPAGKHFIWGTGRRKKSVARVRIRPGTGKFLVNDREVTAFFPSIRDQNAALLPMRTANMVGTWDVFVNVNGGGTTGQAGAISLGLARSLLRALPELDATLRNMGLLTRDARMKERKKYGQKGARKRFQFSKR